MDLCERGFSTEQKSPGVAQGLLNSGCSHGFIIHCNRISVQYIKDKSNKLRVSFRTYKAEKEFPEGQMWQRRFYYI